MPDPRDFLFHMFRPFAIIADFVAGIFISIFDIKPKTPELFEEKEDKYYYR
jgi:hypothetical protein